jgi:hypothetical protein
MQSKIPEASPEMIFGIDSQFRFVTDAIKDVKNEFELPK